MKSIGDAWRTVNNGQAKQSLMHHLVQWVAVIPHGTTVTCTLCPDMYSYRSLLEKKKLCSNGFDVFRKSCPPVVLSINAQRGMASFRIDSFPSRVAQPCCPVVLPSCFPHQWSEVYSQSRFSQIVVSQRYQKLVPSCNPAYCATLLPICDVQFVPRLISN